MSTTDVGPLSVLARIRQAQVRSRPGDRCELCTEELAERHDHLVNLESRGLLCACKACALLFTHHGASGGHYRAVPGRYLVVPDFALAPWEWEALQIPVGVAFFFINSSLGRIVAFYPSPAGATECQLALDSWDGIVAANPLLGTIEPDVEAVLIRSEPDVTECFVVPIDACYELVGHLRRLWRGFDGGREARDQLETFFADLRSRGRPTSAGSTDD